MKNLASQVLEGDARSIARLISLVENEEASAIEAMKAIYPSTGKAHVIGITGVMGSGKSSLIFEIAYLFRKEGKKVGVLAVDPTSPFSGGALLGDRVRMMELSSDEDVFIRSMGTHGMLGGLTSSVYDVVDIFDAAGMDIVLVETVGVGQAEVDIVKIADTTLVVLVPGLGDSIQTIKAGLMEIADIFVVNKADRPGIGQTVAELEAMLDLSNSQTQKIPIVETSTRKKQGLSMLLEEIKNHFQYLHESHTFEVQRKKRYEAELSEIIRKKLMNFIFDESTFKKRIDVLVDHIAKRKLDPYSAAEEILKKLLH
jgi:LAO/AO transport system kinase